MMLGRRIAEAIRHHRQTTLELAGEHLRPPVGAQKCVAALRPHQSIPDSMEAEGQIAGRRPAGSSHDPMAKPRG
jgi:hypothetical protein